MGLFKHVTPPFHFCMIQRLRQVKFCPDSFRLDRTPWELRPPKFFNFNAKLRIWLRLVTASTAISEFLSAIVVDRLADNRCAKYELPSLITVSTAGTQTWLPRYLTQAFRYAEASLEVPSDRKFEAIRPIFAKFVVRHTLKNRSEFQPPILITA